MCVWASGDREGPGPGGRPEAGPTQTSPGWTRAQGSGRNGGPAHPAAPPARWGGPRPWALPRDRKLHPPKTQELPVTRTRRKALWRLSSAAGTQERRPPPEPPPPRGRAEGLGFQGGNRGVLGGGGVGGVGDRLSIGGGKGCERMSPVGRYCTENTHNGMYTPQKRTAGQQTTEPGNPGKEKGTPFPFRRGLCCRTAFLRGVGGGVETMNGFGGLLCTLSAPTVQRLCGQLRGGEHGGWTMTVTLLQKQAVTFPIHTPRTAWRRDAAGQPGRGWGPRTCACSRCSSKPPCSTEQKEGWKCPRNAGLHRNSV